MIFFGLGKKQVRPSLIWLDLVHVAIQKLGCHLCRGWTWTANFCLVNVASMGIFSWQISRYKSQLVQPLRLLMKSFRLSSELGIGKMFALGHLPLGVHTTSFSYRLCRPLRYLRPRYPNPRRRTRPRKFWWSRKPKMIEIYLKWEFNQPSFHFSTSSW